MTFCKIVMVSNKNLAHTMIPVTSFPCTYGGRAACPHHSGDQATSPRHMHTKRPLSLPLYEPMITGPLVCETAIRQLASARIAAPAVTNFANTHGDRSLESSTRRCAHNMFSKRTYCKNPQPAGRRLVTSAKLISIALCRDIVAISLTMT